MKPIINPWWIYLAEKSEMIGMGLITIGIISLVIFFIWLLFNEGGSIPLKWILFLGLVTLLFGAILPSQKTVLTMMTVQQLTPNNIEIVGDTLEDTIDYIIEKIEDITDEKDN